MTRAGLHDVPYLRAFFPCLVAYKHVIKLFCSNIYINSLLTLRLILTKQLLKFEDTALFYVTVSEIKVEYLHGSSIKRCHVVKKINTFISYLVETKRVARHS